MAISDMPRHEKKYKKQSCIRSLSAGKRFIKGKNRLSGGKEHVKTSVFLEARRPVLPGFYVIFLQM